PRDRCPDETCRRPHPALAAFVRTPLAPPRTGARPLPRSPQYVSYTSRFGRAHPTGRAFPQRDEWRSPSLLSREWPWSPDLLSVQARSVAGIPDALPFEPLQLRLLPR